MKDNIIQFPIKERIQQTQAMHLQQNTLTHGPTLEMIDKKDFKWTK